jgi:putative phage-type endonuclease
MEEKKPRAKRIIKKKIIDKKNDDLIVNDNSIIQEKPDNKIPNNKIPDKPNQIDNINNSNNILDMQIKVQQLRQIISPKQRSPEWFNMRNNAITASDGGCVLGVNKYEPEYKFLLKKVNPASFKTNSACYHGKKFEQIATMIYANKQDVNIEEYGLLLHPQYSFLGASPDGIAGKYKSDNKTETELVGRMLEIKCPVSRKINSEGDAFDICPEYYWVQVQLQLECCDLDICDFWQCNITEYKTRQEFLEDTGDNIYMSKETGLEKGCLIQLLPKSKISEITKENYYDIIYDFASFIYPDKIHMSIEECDKWIADQLEELNKNEEYKSYSLDRVIYWRLNNFGLYSIKRDKVWFAEKLPKLREMWNYVDFFRLNKDLMDILNKHIESMSYKYNNKIMDLVRFMYNTPDKTEIIKYIDNLKKQTTTVHNSKKSVKCLFDD